MAEQKTLTKLKRKRLTVKACGVTASVLPLLITLAVRWREYFAPATGWKVGTGAVIGLTLAVLAVAGKIEKPHALLVLGVAVLMEWLLASILHDLMLLTVMAFAGEIIYMPFKASVTKTEEEIAMRKQADMTAEAVREALNG